MSFKKAWIAVVLLFALLFSFFSCDYRSGSPSPKSHSFSTYFFGTTGRFYDYSGSSQKSFDTLAERVENELTEYHKLYDIYNEYEGMVNLATLNRTAGSGPVKVDKRIIDLLLFSKEMYELTGGEVNVAMGAVLKIWHDFREDGKKLPADERQLPDINDLRAAAEHTDINDLVIDEENLTVSLLDPEMRLDVGATAKGYAVEMVAAGLEAEGLSGYVLDVGRNLRAIGTKPSGAGWTAGVVNPLPLSSEPYVYKTEIKNEALVTSGSYENFYTVGGVNYHHIINNDSLFPENYYLSVTVRSDSSALCDALTTALFNMPFEVAHPFVLSLNDVFAVFVFPDGAVATVGERKS